MPPSSADVPGEGNSAQLRRAGCDKELQEGRDFEPSGFLLYALAQTVSIQRTLVK